MHATRNPRVSGAIRLPHASTSCLCLIGLMSMALLAAQPANAFTLPKTLHVGPINAPVRRADTPPRTLDVAIHAWIPFFGSMCQHLD